MAFNSMPYGPRIVYILRRSDMRDPFEDGQPAPFYVGQGRSNRIYMHLWEARNTQKNTRKLNIMRAVERNGGVITADIVASDLPYHIGLIIEQQLIDFYGRDSHDGLLANRTAGGEGVKALPEETRQRIAEAKRGQKRTPEQIERMRKSRIGFKHTEASKANMRKGYKPRILSEETRAKMRASAALAVPKKRPPVYTPETRARKIALLKARPPELSGIKKRGRENGAARPLIAEGIEYGTVEEAAQALGINTTTLYMRIRRGDARYVYLPWHEDVGKRLSGAENGNARSVRLNGIEYPTVTHAIIALGIGKTTFYRRVRKGVYLLEDVE